MDTQKESLLGKVHSIESFGTVDGPGIRVVIFFKGCSLRCQYCHNPDTWGMENAKMYTVEELIKEIMKYESYISNGGGVTVSGGEPLLQIEFVTALFQRLKELHIHTACDTSGITFQPKNITSVRLHKKLIEVTDLFLLDIKEMNQEEHQKLTGKTNQNILAFAEFLSLNNKSIWIRHVVIPGITLREENLLRLREFIRSLKTVEKIEFLPYHTMGIEKYKQLQMEYPLEGVVPPTNEQMEYVHQLFENEMKEGKND